MSALNKRNKRIILVVSLVLLINFVFSPVPSPERKKIAESVVYINTPIINPLEMESFLKIWSEYLDEDISEIGISQLSIGEGGLSAKLPKKVLAWFTKRSWNIDRFFYVEQRMKSIVKAATLKKQSINNIKLLEELRKNDAQAVSGIERLIREQEEAYKVEQVSDDEIAMVTTRLKEISDILYGKTKTE